MTSPIPGIILEGSDAIGYHSTLGQAAAITYRDQIWDAIGGADGRPIAVLGTGVWGTVGSGTHAISTFATFAAAGALSNYVAVYFLGTPGSAVEDDTLVTGNEAAITAYLVAGGTVMISGYLGHAAWDFAVGTGGAAGPHVVTSGIRDSETITAAGLAAGLTQPGAMSFYEHFSYEKAFFGPLGFTTSFIDAGSIASGGLGPTWSDVLVQTPFSGSPPPFICDEFDEVRFPPEIAFSSKGGSAMRQTQIVVLGSGAEKRKDRWQNSRRTYDIGYGLHSMDDIHTVISFFECRNARLIGFRLEDWADWKSCPPEENVEPFDQLIGVGDGVTTTFQLTKLYTSGARTWVRKIIKPVAGTVHVALGGVEQLSGWTVDTTTGIVTFASPPTGGSPGVSVHAGFEFDTPVRFDTDKLEINLAQHRAGQAQSIPMIELPD